MNFYKSLEKIIPVFYEDESIAGYHFYCRNIMNGEQRMFSVTDSQVGDRNPQGDAISWREGTPIKNAFPYLYPDERELLLTGLRPDELENIESLGEWG